MRILLGHNSTYYPSQGGGDKSNRLLMEALAARGHDVRVVTRLEQFGAAAHERYVGLLQERGIAHEVSAGAVLATLNHVDVRTLTLEPQIRAYFAKQIDAFDPGIILISTDDPAHLLLEPALAAARARVVYLVRATIAVPFGPDSSGHSPVKTERLRQVDGIVGVSESVARYMCEWGRMDAIHVPISLMEPREHSLLGRFENTFVTMVNPCAVKGIAIFLELAGRMPDVRFAAVPTWGTNDEDLAALRRHANIAILEPVENIDIVLRQTRVMLVPSVWAEARSRMVLESMARGIPVIASNVGGLPEAKMGVDYLIPVNVVKHYQPALDSRMVPVADVPAQDIALWERAVRRLVTDRDHWEALAKESREAALRYIGNLTAEPFEKYLQSVLAAPGKVRSDARREELSPEKRKLLAMRMRQAAKSESTSNRNAESSKLWFPRCGSGFRLFCFPHAGAGTFLYRHWGAHVCPVAMPGRESRFVEPAFDRMEALVDALETAIAPLLDRPFAFFGHSMGAGVAFELARALRRKNLPLPRALFASATRAPHLRTGPPKPEPPDAELLQEIRRMGGLGGGENPELIELAMPTLRADTRLYRNYVYRKEAPLQMPIFAYHGVGDPTIPPETVAAWREETTGPFRFREFPGGHFYLREESSGFMEAFRADQAEVMGDSTSDSAS
jgi:surfactin synthase thioesterase subunit/glycosyltransferase involved in cell wall biosynthesis